MNKFTFDYTKYKDILLQILKEIDKEDDLSWRKLRQILGRYPKDGNKMFTKNHLVKAFREVTKEYPNMFDENIVHKIQMKPIRTQSGVTTVTVLTKPFPCPGKCIFCPNDIRMPKSYLADEPGAQRASRNRFDPYLQTYRRLTALKEIGHNTQKIEMIILGGTWSFYPENYQIWFIKRCFEAINDFGDEIDQTVQIESNTSDYEISDQDLNSNNIKENKFNYNKVITDITQKSNKELNEKSESASWEELFEQHKRNETNNSRCVGLTVETRPDNISVEEVIRIRKLGCTKTQIGIQSLRDEILDKNKRGHRVADTIYAIKLLRSAGFKIHAHWMANLYGANVQEDIEDFKKLFNNPEFHPDELKIYPCVLIETAELIDYYNAGKWTPYSEEELVELLSSCIAYTPEYCRLTRIIREFSSDVIVDGSKKTNLRQVVEKKLIDNGIELKDIRSREIQTKIVEWKDLIYNQIIYRTTNSTEFFLQYITNSNKIVGFLRLSLPDSKINIITAELNDSAIIREIHVYGRVNNIGEQKKGHAQHLGLGTKLIEKAKEISKLHNYKQLAVISSVGTREYYRKRGFSDGVLYQKMEI
jgi:elongator complex protein 3